MILGEQSPILGQSLAWFKGETKRMSEVRSSELETGLSSSDGPVKGDMAVSAPRSVRAFYALEEACGTLILWPGSKIDFNFLSEFVFVGPIVRTGPATSSLVRYASTRLLSLVGLGFQSIRL